MLFSSRSHYFNNWISPACLSFQALWIIKDLSYSFPKDYSGFKTQRPFSAKFALGSVI